MKQCGVLFLLLGAFNLWASQSLSGTFYEQLDLSADSAPSGVIEYGDGDSKSCRMDAGMADSYVLAMSSQPGFCQTYGYEAGKPECMNLSSNSYQANHLTLHGLWPNQRACGQHYGFCGTAPRANHCDYPAIVLAPDVVVSLKKLMPSYQYGSCLERHEWNKHGTCQLLTPDDYFSLAMRLGRELDDSDFGHYLTEHKGKRVLLSTIKKLLAATFGRENVSKIFLGCKNRILVDVWIQLPALMPLDESLGSLIQKAPVNQGPDSCPERFVISSFSKKSWGMS